MTRRDGHSSALLFAVLVAGAATPARAGPLTTPIRLLAIDASPALPEAHQPPSLIHRLRLFKGPQQRVPITWYTYYVKIHRSSFIRQLVKATSIALGAKVRGYYTLTLGMRLGPERDGRLAVVPDVQGW